MFWSHPIRLLVSFEGHLVVMLDALSVFVPRGPENELTLQRERKDDRLIFGTTRRRSRR